MFVPLIEIEEIWNPNSQFSKIFGSNLGIFSILEYTDRKLSVIRANERFFEKVNISRDIIYNKELNVLDLIHTQDKEDFTKKLDEVFEGNKQFSMELKAKDLNDLSTYFKSDIKVVPLITTATKLILLVSYENIEKIKN